MVQQVFLTAITSHRTTSQLPSSGDDFPGRHLRRRIPRPNPLLEALIAVSQHDTQLKQPRDPRHCVSRPAGAAIGIGMAAQNNALAIVFYCTGHGLGHATRSLEICKHLVAAGHTGKCRSFSLNPLQPRPQATAAAAQFTQTPRTSPPIKSRAPPTYRSESGHWGPSCGLPP